MTVKVGLVGAGFIGKTHAHAYESIPEAEVVAVADIDREAADSLAEKVGARACYDAQEVISAQDVQVVDICLPTYLHARFVVEAAREGKHVLCEKPIALTLDQADHMVAAIRESGVISMVAHVIRFWPQYVTIKELFDSGSLGTPVLTRAVRLSEAPGWASWFKDPQLSGGAILDLHIHDLDYVYSLFGRPQSVYAVGAKSEFGAWDSVVTALDYGDSKAVVEASNMMPDGYPFEMDLRLLGSEGCAEYRFRVSGQVGDRDSAQTELRWYRSGAPAEDLPYSQEDAYHAELAYFVQCVSEGRHPTQATFEEAREVLEIALAARESLETGAVIRM